MGGKKKWSKGKVREKMSSLVVFDTKSHDRLIKEVPKMKLITTSALQERLKINGSLARSAIKLLLKKKLIKKVHVHHAQRIYTRATHE